MPTIKVIEMYEQGIEEAIQEGDFEWAEHLKEELEELHKRVGF